MASDGGAAGADRAIGVADWVYEQLREGILAGELKPGERVRQSAVAKRFSVSQTPVREALARLASVGLVELQPRRGAVVNSLSPKEIDEVYELRELLDPYVARKAAVAASDEELRAIVDAAEACKEPNLTPVELFHRNRSFHRAIYEGCGNSHMIALFESLWDSVTAVRMFDIYASDPEELEQMGHEHDAISEALVARDANRAEAVVREHIAAARRDLLALLDELSDGTDPAEES